VAAPDKVLEIEIHKPITATALVELELELELELR
jgi:hypothetical protein